MQYSETAKDVLKKEISCLKKMEPIFDNHFDEFVKELDDCKGILIWTGIGKSGLICRKIVATMQSLSIKSVFLHPVEGLHGDIGLISPRDIVIIVSNSGETKELIDLVIPIKNIGAKIFSIVGKHDSYLEQQSYKTLIIDGIKETFLDIVPTTSTTDELVLGDAISVAIAKNRKFTAEQFAEHHPSGQLGKKLTLRVKDVMIKGTENSVVLKGSTLEQAIFEMCRKSVSAVSIVTTDGKLAGYFTDGDLRRYSSKPHSDIKKVIIDDVMNLTPICLNDSDLLYDAIVSVISKHSVTTYPVVDSKHKNVGTVRMIDVVKTGLYT